MEFTQEQIEQIVDDKIASFFAKRLREEEEKNFVAQNQRAIEEAVTILGWETYYIIDPMTKKTTKKLPPEKEAQIIEYVKNSRRGPQS